MKSILFMIIANLIIAAISSYIIYIQTDHKTKVLVVLIIILGLTNVGVSSFNFLSTRPKATLVLDKIENHFTGNPPDAAAFLIKIKNAGNNTAKNIKIRHELYIDNELKKEGVNEQNDIAPAVTVGFPIEVAGETFNKIWNEEQRLKIKLVISYKGGVLDKEMEFKPKRQLSPILDPAWIIVK